MKNKEIEELLNKIKQQLIIDEKLGKEIAQDFHKTTLNYEEIKLLLSYIEQLENKYNKALEILSDYNMPCEYVKPIIPDEYCEENCEVSDEVYKKCWNKHIELTLKGDSDE